MSVYATAWGWKQQCDNPGQMLVLLAMCDNASGPDTETPGMCYPSIKHLASKCGLSERQVKRHLVALDERGLVTKDRRLRRADGTMGVWRYTVHYQGTPAAPGDSTRGHGGSTPEDTEGKNQGTPMSPQEPSVEPSVEPSLLSLIPADSGESGDRQFEEWWAAYPRKVAKQDARRAWAKLDPAERAISIERIPMHCAYWQRTNRATEHIPHPATWLNRASWTDELDMSRAVANTRSGRTEAAAVEWMARHTQQTKGLTDGHGAHGEAVAHLPRGVPAQ